MNTSALLLAAEIQPMFSLSASRPLILAYRLSTEGGRGCGRILQGCRETVRSLAGKALSSQILSPIAPGYSDKSRTSCIIRVWRLHTDELGPDLTEAGTFLKEEGFNKECSPQLGLRSGLTIPGPASLAGVIGLRDVSWEMRCERP